MRGHSVSVSLPQLAGYGNLFFQFCKKIVCKAEKKWFREQICLSHRLHFITWNVFIFFLSCHGRNCTPWFRCHGGTHFTLHEQGEISFFEGVELESVFTYIKYFYFLNTSLEESIKNWLLPNPHTPLFTRNFIKCFIKILRMFQHLNHVEWLSSCDHKISSNHTWLDKKVLFSKQGHILKTL